MTEPTPEQMRCGYALYGPPALCTCGICRVLTERERLALEYLDDKQASPASFVGRYVWNHASKKAGSNLPALGAAVLGRLRRKGFVDPVIDGMWRITQSGRAALANG